MKNLFFIAINYRNVNNNSLWGRLCVCVFVCVRLIEQLCPLPQKKMISSGTNWGMTTSGLHMSCLGFKGEGLTEYEGEQVSVLADLK